MLWRRKDVEIEMTKTARLSKEQVKGLLIEALVARGHKVKSIDFEVKTEYEETGEPWQKPDEWHVFDGCKIVLD
jgi:hypothetical protein